MKQSFQDFELGYDTPVDPLLQRELETVDANLRASHGLTPNQTAVGLFDARTLRLAMLRPDSDTNSA